jgi:tRNA pseudouridine55 synthase
MNGVLVVDKPAGPSSHDAVARVRRALRIRAIGHTGTLDPLATGVLPLVIGKATRLAQFLAASEKEYIAEVRFGASTDTFDAEERPPQCPVPDLTAAEVEKLLEPFRGSYRQTPPAYSAKKIAGTPAYRFARARKPVTITPVEVHVSELELQAFEAGAARLRIVASTGFYVRVLAHELGRLAGCGAYLSGLRRVRAGEFSLEHAVTLEDVEREGPGSSRHVIPMNRLLAGLPAVVLTERGLRRAAHGNSLSPEDFSPPAAHETGLVRLLDGSGGLLGIGKAATGGALHPSIVLR